MLHFSPPLCTLPAAGSQGRPIGSPGAFHARTSDTIAGLYEAAKGDGLPRETRIPGYTGHISGLREVAGRTHSRAAARALAHGAQELVWRDSLPSDPQSKLSLVRLQASYSEEVLGRDMTTTPIGRVLEGAGGGHVAGYTGHVVGLRECALSESFGRVTAAAGHTRLNPKEARVCVNVKTMGGGRERTRVHPPPTAPFAALSWRLPSSPTPSRTTTSRRTRRARRPSHFMFLRAPATHRLRACSLLPPPRPPRRSRRPQREAALLLRGLQEAAAGSTHGADASVVVLR